MIFITPQLYDEYRRNGIKWFVKYLEKMYPNNTENWYLAEANRLVIILHIRHIVRTIDDAYFYDNEGLIDLLSQHLKEMPIVQYNIPAYIYGLYDLLIWRRWDEAKTYYDALSYVGLGYVSNDPLLEIIETEYKHYMNEMYKGTLLCELSTVHKLNDGVLSPNELVALLERKGV